MIIGITGPAGSGKDTVATYLESKLRIPHISGGDILREMLTSLGFEPKKAALGPFGTFLRTQYGADAIVNKVIEKAKGEGFIVNGFRSPAEAALLKENNAFIIYIEAPEQKRYERMGARLRIGDESEEHHLKNLDQQEHSSSLLVGENLEKVKLMADVVIENDGSLADLYQKLNQVCAALNRIGLQT